MRKFVTVMVVLFLLLYSSTFAFAENNAAERPTVEDVVSDVLWLRPMGLIWTIIGGAAFGVSYPVTHHLNKTKEASEFLVQDPYSFTFERRLGEM